MNNNIVIIPIGSNIDAEKNIRLMLDLLGEETEIVKVSRLVKTIGFAAVLFPGLTPNCWGVIIRQSTHLQLS
jgi:hypothetical protein